MSNRNFYQIITHRCLLLVVQHKRRQHEIQIFLSLFLQSNVLLMVISGFLEVTGISNFYDGEKIKQFYESPCLYFQ